MTRLLALVLLVALASCRSEAPAGNSPEASSAEELSVDNAWARPVRHTGEGSASSAAYFTIENRGAGAAFLVGAESDVSPRTEIHGTILEDGVMRMRPQERVEVPAGGTIAFEPGGLHVMLMDVTRELVAGDSLGLVLHFDDGRELDVTVLVRPATL